MNIFFFIVILVLILLCCLILSLNSLAYDNKYHSCTRNKLGGSLIEDKFQTMLNFQIQEMKYINNDSIEYFENYNDLTSKTTWLELSSILRLMMSKINAPHNLVLLFYLIYTYIDINILKNELDNIIQILIDKLIEYANAYMSIILPALYTHTIDHDVSSSYFNMINMCIIYIYLLYCKIDVNGQGIISITEEYILKTPILLKHFLCILCMELFIVKMNKDCSIIYNGLSELMHNILYDVTSFFINFFNYKNISQNDECKYLYYILFNFIQKIEVKSAFNKFSIIEVDQSFQSSESTILSNKIKSYTKKLVELSRSTPHSKIIDAIFNLENDNFRDKFLNNTGLFVIRVIADNYICILLYPFLFKAYKAYQMQIDSLESARDSTYVRIFEKDDKNYSKEYNISRDNGTITAEKKISGGDNKGACTQCGCKSFIRSAQAEWICSCGHTNVLHNKETNLRLNMKKFTNTVKQVSSQIVTNKRKLDFLLDMFKDTIDTYFAELETSSLSETILEYLPIFYIPHNLAKQWRPMNIKPFQSIRDYYDIPKVGSNIPPYNMMKTFITVAHGNNTPENEPSTIDLFENEIVVMSCNPWDILQTDSNLFILQYSLKGVKKNNLMQLLEYYNIITSIRANRKYVKLTDLDINYSRNLLCVYTKRCPNLLLQFYDNAEFSNIPFTTIEWPAQYSSKTIDEFITKNDLIPSTHSEINELLLNNTDNIPNLITYMCNHLDSISLTYNALPEYIPRMKKYVEAMENQEHLELSDPNREIKTYYKHINFQKQETNTLEKEIKSMREYYKTLPESSWENNPGKYVIYFVFACRI